jgi:hypothetical protein
MTRRRIEIIGDAGDDWPFAASLKSISEDTAQEYEGRAILELIQNGHDAIGRETAGRIHVLLDTDPDDPVLYVANDGAPFSWANFLAIISFGLSDKGAGEGIGNKGLGFRSVLRLTDRPEVYSRDPANPADREFSGYSFRFPTNHELGALTEDDELSKRLVAEASPLDLPVPALTKDPDVRRFGSEGFASVVKLPLRDAAAATDARRQIDALVGAEAPILLFLDRITSLEFTVRSWGLDTESVPLTRSETPSPLTEDSDWTREVDLGPQQGHYLLARRQTNPEAFREAIRRSVEVRQVDARWLDWDGEAWVGVALRLDRPLGSGLVYTFLPMQETAPLAAHIHAPFFTKLARRDLDLGIALNDYLMGEIAAVCLHLLRALREHGDHSTVVPLVVDLAAWNPPGHEFLSRACLAAESTLATEKIIPVAGKREWSSLEGAFVWPLRLEALSVVSASAVAALQDPILDPTVGRDRQGRLVKLHSAVMGTAMEPNDEAMATWVEALAVSMQSSADVGFDTWASFYDELAVAFPGGAAAALRGRTIILDQDSRLRPAMGSPGDGRRARLLFFAPSVDDEGADAAAVKLPRPLASRVAYTHAEIPWNVMEPTRRRRPGRSFLEANGFVREYRTDRLLEVLRDFLTSRRPSDAVRGAALEFACALYPTLNKSQRLVLADVPFDVPTIGGAWLPASETAFSRSWETEGGILLDRMLAFASDETPELRSVQEGLIASPNAWPVVVIKDRSRWEAFLRAIGVHDGLPLRRVRLNDGPGNLLHPPSITATTLSLAPDLKTAWISDVSSCWSGGAHPYTNYRFSNAITLLPGAGEVELLADEAREIYAQLIARGLSAWSDDTFRVTVSRPERRIDDQDEHVWPTPASSYLQHAAWLPIEGIDDDDAEHQFVRPSKAWLSSVGQLPRFVPPIAPPVRGVVASGLALERLRTLGVRIWEDPQFCGQVLRELPELLQGGYVAPHYAASFKKQCRQAWHHLAEDSTRWPWHEGETPIAVVTEGAPIHALSLGKELTVFVPDETDQTKQALFALTPQPVLVVDPAEGADVAEILNDHRLDVVRTSQVSLEVFGDDQLVNPSPEHPGLVSPDRQWLATVVALVAELRSGSFTRHTEQSIRQLLERLQRIRLIKVASVRLLLGDQDIEPPEQTTSLPIEDEVAPTIVTWAAECNVFEELEQCAESIAFLIRQSQLAAPLQLVFSRLSRSGLPRSTPHLDDQVLASALQVSEAQIRESRADLRGPLFELVDRLRVLLVYFGGIAAVDDFDARTRDAPDDEAIIAALATWKDVLPLAAPQLSLKNPCDPGKLTANGRAVTMG